MATASKIELSTNVGDWPEYYQSGITQDQAKKASELLQQNHDNYHLFYDPRGFHNHIVHHILAIWALNASSKELQDGFNQNKPNQRGQPSIDQDMLKNLADPQKFVAALGQKENMSTFVQFFKAEIEESSVEDVLQKYTFAGDERADKMLVCMYAGFLHPIIHLGYGLEFHQPAIVAEGLASAACHEAWIGDFLLPAEKAAKERAHEKATKSIVQLLNEIHDDKALRVAAHWDDDNKIRDGIIPRGGKAMIEYASQFRINSPDELEEKTAEMTNAVCYYTAGAQHPPNMVMYDFYFMHCVNSTIFYSTFAKLPWLSTPNKIRLLEWKVRMDLAMYASRRCPDMRLDEIRNYKPQKPGDWNSIISRVNAFPDDGHASKLIRALAHGQKICEPYEDKENFRVKRDDWLQMGHMAIDSVENADRFSGVAHWIRSAGFEEAWERIPVRAQL